MSVGLSPVRRGALERATGRALFGADMARPGDLSLACVRAEAAPAVIKDIDPSAALKLPGVMRVFTAADVPGENRLGIIALTRDQEFLAQRIVRFKGQAVALVAAETIEAARRGALAVKVRLAPLTGVFDPQSSLKPGAPAVHESGNLLYERLIIKGRAEWQDGRVVIWACTQNPHYDQAEISRFLGVSPEKVRIIQAETGGAFGGKLDVSIQPYLALAAFHLQRPASMIFSREESFLATAKRHPFWMSYQTGADDEGRLEVMIVDLVADTGAFASYGLAVAVRAAVHATGPYFVPHVKIRCRMAYTNRPWSGAMRGFGVPQVALGHEGQMDALALKTGLDPLQVRLLNALRPGQATATGQVLKSGVGIVECLKRIKKIHAAWRKRAASSARTLEGVGLGAMFYGIGNTGVKNPSTAQVEWTADGRLILYTGAAELGQGSDTVLAQMAAQRLGLALERIEVVRGDTDKTTDAGASSASRQTYISGNAVVQAAAALEDLLLGQAEEMLEVHCRDLALRGDEIVVAGSPQRAVGVLEVVRRLKAKGIKAQGRGRFDPAVVALDPETGQGVPYAAYAFAAQTAWAVVDKASGMVRVERVAAAHDVGQAIHRRAVLGQICGGVVMGLGMALMEEFEPQRTSNFRDYHVPTFRDAPRITPLIVEVPEESGPFGAKGVGEPALIPTAPAVVGAVSQALGQPMPDLPLNLERVMAALAERQG